MSVRHRRSRAARPASQHSPAPAPGAEPPLVGAGGASRGGRLGVVLRWRWVLVVATLVAGAAGYIVTAGERPDYEAHARLLVGPLDGEQKTLRAASQLTQTYAQLAIRRPVIEATARKLNLRPQDVRLRAEASPVTRLLTIRVRQGDPRLGARIANVHADELIARSKRPDAGSARAGRLQVVDPAVPDTTPVGPGAFLRAGIAALAGLLGALLLAFPLDRSDDAVKSSEDVEAATGAPCVGVLTRGAVRAAKRERPVVEAASDSRAAREFRMLAAKLDARGDQSLLVIPLHGDAGALARNLAAALAADGSHVALVDVGAAANGHAHHVAVDGTWARNANSATPSGAEPARGTRVAPANEVAGDDPQAALDHLGTDVDVVVLHAAGLERSATALAWARVADGTILVARRDHTAARKLRATAETLRMVGAPIVGTVLAEPPPVLRR
jgi:capsular polysaccharide biosynthesis protein